MIAKLVVYRCRNCNSQNIVKNGHNASGSQQYLCKDCGKRGVLEPKRGYTEAQKEQILSAYHERSSMRGVERTFGVSRPTLVSWLKKERNQSKTWRHTLARRTRRCAGSRRNVVVCPGKMEQTLDLDGYVSPHSPNRSLCHRRSEWSDLSQALGTNSTSLQRLSKLQWFLGSLSTRLSFQNTWMCWQRERADQSHGALVLHLEAILCAVRQKNIILFKIWFHARNRHSAFHHPLQPITYYLATTLLQTRVEICKELLHTEPLLAKKTFRVSSMS